MGLYNNPKPKSMGGDLQGKKNTKILNIKSRSNLYNSGLSVDNNLFISNFFLDKKKDFERK